MGRPAGSKNRTSGTGMAKPNKRTPTKLRPVQPTKDGHPTQPWQILQDLLAECSFFEKIRVATFRMFWTRDSKADADGVMLGSRASKATERERLVAEENKRQHDLTITLPECWNAMNDRDKEQMIFHALLRFAPVLKSSGEQKTDTRDRLQWRLRRPPIVAFVQEFERYGVEYMLGCNAVLADAARHADRPMEKIFDAAEAMADSVTLTTASGSVTVPLGAIEANNPLRAWRRWPTSCLADYGLPAGKLKLLEEAGLGTMGKLMDRMNKAGSEGFWWKDIKGFGESGYDAMVNAIMGLRKANSHFQAEEQAAPPAEAVDANEPTTTADGDGDLETRALALSNAGKGMKSIAKELGVSERAVRKLLGRL